MSIQPDHDLLPTLRRMREKIELDPAPRTPSLRQLYALLVHPIAELEDAQMITPSGTRHA